jgi:DNA modification methylase
MIKILNGDCRDILSQMPNESIHCCVTSPPYFGLRDYGVEGQIGLEQTPDEYVAEMVSVFREVRRVLRDGGTLWLNLGDSYASYRDGKCVPNSVDGNQKAMPKTGASNSSASTFKGSGIKHKDLIGIPWRVAFALQVDGWYLRQDIIWHKPNPMPESVRDRCTKAHEYIFLLSKSERYYFDHEAMKEEGVIPAGTKGAKGSTQRAAQAGVNARPPEYKIYDGKRNRRSVWTVNTRPFKGAHFATYPPALIEPCIKAGCPVGGTVLDPFFGAGTTGLVARDLGRNCIGVELNPDYAELAGRRLGVGAGPRQCRLHPRIAPLKSTDRSVDDLLGILG